MDPKTNEIDKGTVDNSVEVKTGEQSDEVNFLDSVSLQPT